MEREELLARIAPCSLMCHTCGAYEKGVIGALSRELTHYFKGVAEFYEKHSGANDPKPRRRFQIFQEELARYGAPACGGCRSGAHNQCSIRGCFLPACTREHCVDFCGECAAFPCDRAAGIFEKEVYAQWLEGNMQIRRTGVEEFWRRNKDRPHYRRYQVEEPRHK